jgi:protein involved in ribonucleotide reduction
MINLIKKILKGIVVTGNVNFGEYFCKAGDLICRNFNVPIIRKIDLRGTQEDINEIRKQYKIHIEGEKS